MFGVEKPADEKSGDETSWIEHFRFKKGGLKIPFPVEVEKSGDEVGWCKN